MKRLILVLIGVLLSLQVQGLVSANETAGEQVEELLEEKVSEEKSDLKKVKSALQEFLKKNQKAERESKDDTSLVQEEESSLGYEQYEYDRAYCVQYVEWFMITEYYKQNRNFDKLILSDYEWCVPYIATNDRKGVATLIEDGDDFIWISESDNETREVILPDKEEIIFIAEKSLGKEKSVEEIKYLGNGLYHLNMVYIKCDKNNYIIPYAEHPKILNAEAQDIKLENGKLYPVEDFMDTMNTLFDEKSWMNVGEDEVGGGLPYRQPHTMRVVMVTGFLLTAMVIFVIWKYRKHNIRRGEFRA